MPRRPDPATIFGVRILPVILPILAGCALQTREARAVQPDPAQALQSVDAIAESVPLYIYQRDVHLGREYQFRNSAQFAVINKDRLRFHVGIVDYEESGAETEPLRVWLEDASGKRLDPGGRENPRVTRLLLPYRPHPYRPADPSCVKPPCFERITSVIEVYEGQADYVFQAPALAERKDGFTLVVQRGGDVEYRYRWRFGDGTEVQHYGRTKVDDEIGTIAVPGPQTEVVASRREGESW